MVIGGANLGRVGVITNRERRPGSFDVVRVKDANGNSFATRLSNIFVIGDVRLPLSSLLSKKTHPKKHKDKDLHPLLGNKPWISLPRGKGIRLTIAEERDKRLATKQSSG
ncbi:40S ribosomal protein S4, Y-like isoform X1 [Piliocolobus tephrosceles]|uniref:40S ribosomal protein S4, Y-like isoform X1 n=1 Tax=Piliocolobus tephrosceles TaxID=591936 RepID=UPI000E6AF1BA|nr:40S ribosomal protein S4, Y-like isoform X1 [Piliocolobus tephrosceles]